MKLTDEKITNLLVEGKKITNDEFIKDDYKYFIYKVGLNKPFDISLSYWDCDEFIWDHTSDMRLEPWHLDCDTWKEFNQKEIIEDFKKWNGD